MPFEDKGGSHPSRYYQDIAIERVMEAIAAGSASCSRWPPARARRSSPFRSRGNCFTARWNLSREPVTAARASSFLADRNILANQAYNAFSAFPEDALVRIAPDDIRKKGKVPKNGSLFFTIFQTFMSGPKDGQPSPYFGEYPPDFFDFIVIDECHRGGANDESNWRGIMDYFAPAVQLGLTATPKRRTTWTPTAYFGDPVYIYSLKEGINDGFLTPFKVKQIQTTMDYYVYTPDDTVVEGEDRDRANFTTSRTSTGTSRSRSGKRSASKFSWRQINQNEKTLVFCANQAHALLVRDLINQLKTSKDPNYCQRVTANDGALGEQHGCGIFRTTKRHPDHSHHVAKTFDRRGCPQHPQHRFDAAHQYDD
jgi:type I restriction enzyme R subunit